MCAMDRSQIIVYSQSEIINHLDDLFSISSSFCFMRDAHGELFYLSPLFEKNILNNYELKFWFSSIPIDTRLDCLTLKLILFQGWGRIFSTALNQ